MPTSVLTRAYDGARTGANTRESQLTPRKVGNHLLVKRFSLHLHHDDPRIEAQPLYVPGLTMSDGHVHNVVFVCTMANNVWAFDADNGHPIWNAPVHLGKPIRPAPQPHDGFPSASEIDMWGINILWGILGTPVIDPDTNRMYVVCWTSPDGSVAHAVFRLHELNLADGHDVRPPITIDVPAAGPQFIPSHQKQRPALLLSTVPAKTIFVAFAMTREEHDPSHGWLIAFDVATFRRSAAWCTSPHGSGTGIWQAGQGPAADEHGDIYVMTGNYGVEDAHGNLIVPPAGDFPESIVKLRYTPPPAPTAFANLEPIAWFTPFRDHDRNAHGDDDFQDYDLGSGGPIPIPGMGLVVGAGKDGVLYVLDQDTSKFGQGSDLAVLKMQPIFFTYFPGFGVDASKIASLDRFYDGKTHHLHGSPVFWRSPTHGPMLFVWGENECLRAWKVDASGSVSFMAKSAEIASEGLGGRGGMPGGFPTLSADGTTPDTGIVWATAPLHGDANKYVVEGILRAYDATALDPVPNHDGTPRLKKLWDSKQIPNNTFKLSKFCSPLVADGQVFVPTYDGRIDVYGLIRPAHAGPLPTNANL